MFAAIWNWIKALFGIGAPHPVTPIPPPVVVPAPDSSTPWMDWLKSHIGEPEVTGEKATAFDVLVFSHTNDPLDGVEQEGCAATLCANSWHRPASRWLTRSSYGAVSSEKNLQRPPWK